MSTTTTREVRIYRMKAFNLKRRDSETEFMVRRSDRYARPATELVRVSTLDDLILGTRTITPEQQTRFQSDSRLWCVGDVSLLRRKCVAIVGTRGVSVEGAARARRLARELATED